MTDRVIKNDQEKIRKWFVESKFLDDCLSIYYDREAVPKDISFCLAMVFRSQVEPLWLSRVYPKDQEPMYSDKDSDPSLLALIERVEAAIRVLEPETTFDRSAIVHLLEA